jgi:hypothetical protein
MCNSVDTLLGYLVLTWKGLLFSIPVVEVTIDEKNDTKHRSLRLSSVAVYTGTKEAGGESVMYRSNIAMEFCAKLIDLALSERHTKTTHQFVDENRNECEDLIDLERMAGYLHEQSLDAKASRIARKRQQEQTQERGGRPPF